MEIARRDHAAAELSERGRRRRFELRDQVELAAGVLAGEAAELLGLLGAPPLIEILGC